MNSCKNILRSPALRKNCVELYQNCSKISDKRCFNTTSQVDFFNLFKDRSKEPKDFGKYSIVQPGNVSSCRSVPENIILPPYAQSMKSPKPPKEIEIHDISSILSMRQACKLARQVVNWTGTILEVGMTTDDIDRLVHEKIIANHAYPSPLHYMGFPKSVCTSINNVACHGIPDDRPLEDGDLINIDITVYIHGHHGDCSETFMIGNVDEKGRELVKVTKFCLDEAIKACNNFVPFNIIGAIIEEIATKHDFNVVPAFLGHGIGKYFHGPPDIYHCANTLQGTMKTGMIFTIEPILTQGSQEVVILEDGWTAVMEDNARTAQFEQTILINYSGCEILTSC